MATFIIDTSAGEYYTDIGSGGKHDGTEWQACKDVTFPDHLIIDKAKNTRGNFKEAQQINPSLTLKEHITVWNTALPKLKQDKVDQTKDEFYEDLRSYYVRVRIMVNADSDNPSISPWVVIGPFDQLDQKVDVTRDETIVKQTNTFDLNWATRPDEEEI